MKQAFAYVHVRLSFPEKTKLAQIEAPRPWTELIEVRI